MGVAVRGEVVLQGALGVQNKPKYHHYYTSSQSFNVTHPDSGHAG